MSTGESAKSGDALADGAGSGWDDILEVNVTQSPPVKVNATTQPRGDTGPLGDDWSWIGVDGRNVHVAWSDARSGGAIDGIFARVPLARYR